MKASLWQVCGCCTAGTLLVLGLIRAGVVVPPNALFTLVLLLGHSTPTAINVQTLATLHQNGEQAVSALLFWQYMGAILTLPLLLTFFFHVTSSGAQGIHEGVLAEPPRPGNQISLDLRVWG